MKAKRKTSHKEISHFGNQPLEQRPPRGKSTRRCSESQSWRAEIGIGPPSWPGPPGRASGAPVKLHVPRVGGFSVEMFGWHTPPKTHRRISNKDAIIQFVDLADLEARNGRVKPWKKDLEYPPPTWNPPEGPSTGKWSNPGIPESQAPCSSVERYPL